MTQTTAYYLTTWAAGGAPLMNRQPFPSLDACLSFVSAHVVTTQGGEHVTLPFRAGVCVDGGIYELSFNGIDSIMDAPRGTAADWHRQFVCWKGRARALLIEREDRARGAHAEELAEGNAPAPLAAI